MRLLVLSLTGVLAIATITAQTPTPPPTAGSTPTTKPRGGGDSPAQTRGTASSPTASAGLTVDVTDKSGNPVSGVSVGVSGPTDRSGATGSDGSIIFRSMRAGTYRLRFEREGFVTFEREVMLRAGQPLTVSAALTAAPVKPAPVLPPPVAEPPPTTKPQSSSSSRVVEPRLLDIPAFLDRNLIGNEPQRLTLLACAEGGTARLLQVRDPLNDQPRADVDELLYVVAGNGLLHVGNRDTKLTPGFFALVPRGVSHSIRRDGRNPLIAVSILAGTPCTEPTTPSR
jgi:mannose-6-phosphate isomerase-like protein (cupin superfamily)